jgi:glycosyltransferase involved in cell wall biosynthesis
MFDFLILTPWFPNQPDGWPARYISDSAIALTEMGHRVRVGVVRGFVPFGMSRWSPVEHRGHVDVASFDGIEDIREARYFALPGGLMQQAKNRSIDLTVRRLLNDFVAERRPDIVLVHTETIAPSAVEAAHELGLPVTVTLHGENTNPAYLAPSGQRDRFRRGLSQTDSLLVVGNPLIHYAAALSGRDDHIEVVWNGVIPPDQQRHAPKPDVAPVELVTVANLQEGKGVDLLLKALATLTSEGIRDWRLQIVGDGPMRQELQALSEREGLMQQVTFLGVLSNTDVFKVLADADVFVLPSYREAFGVVYLEAMASGLLTIGVTGQGPEQFIQHGETGLLIAPKSVDAVASSLRQVLTGDRKKWRAIAVQGAEFVRAEMTWTAHARRLTSVVEGILKTKNSAAKGIMKKPGTVDALALFIEPAPYMRRLDQELKRQWPGKVTTRFISGSASQEWQSLDEALELQILPKCKIAAFFALWRDMRQHRPGIVFVAGWSHPIVIGAIVMAKLAGARVVSTSDTWKSESTGIRKWGKKSVLRMIDHFTPGGKRQARYLRDIGVPAKHIFPANMTVDTTTMQVFFAEYGAEHRRIIRHELGIDDRGPVFLFVGRLEPIKGIDLLLSAFDELDPSIEARLVIVGDGTLSREVENAMERDTRIVYRGRLEGEALWAQFAAADVLVAPSLSEPWGLVVNEALSAGLAIVVSDVFGCTDDLVNPEKNALVVPAGNQVAVSEVLKRLSSNPHLLERLRGNATQSVEGWTTEAWATNILSAWRDAMNKKARSREYV